MSSSTNLFDRSTKLWIPPFTLSQLANRATFKHGATVCKNKSCTKVSDASRSSKCLSLDARVAQAAASRLLQPASFYQKIMTKKKTLSFLEPNQFCQVCAGNNRRHICHVNQFCRRAVEIQHQNIWSNQHGEFFAADGSASNEVNKDSTSHAHRSLLKTFRAAQRNTNKQQQATKPSKRSKLSPRTLAHIPANLFL